MIVHKPLLLQIWRNVKESLHAMFIFPKVTDYLVSASGFVQKIALNWTTMLEYSQSRINSNKLIQLLIKTMKICWKT
jgi:hypothetical protein